MNQNKIFQTRASSILSCHITAFYLERLKSTPYAKRLLKKRINLALIELKKQETSEIDVLYDEEDEATTHLADVHYDCINEFSSVPLHLQGELTEVIREFKAKTK